MIALLRSDLGEVSSGAYHVQRTTIYFDFILMSFSKVESCFAYCSITENEYTEEWMKKVYSDPKTRRGWVETILVKCQRIQLY